MKCEYRNWRPEYVCWGQRSFHEQDPIDTVVSILLLALILLEFENAKKGKAFLDYTYIPECSTC